MAKTDTPTDLAELRHDVRAVVEDWLAAGRFEPSCDAWLRGYDLEFSRCLAENGWLGITWPVEHGGQARANTARLVVTEELLRAGAPVAAHWIADRQIGPAILRYGSSELQQAYLPRIASGELTFCLGMSETESGSDLASVRTTAVPTDDGWRLTGRKIWTSQAHRSSHAYVLARTSKGERKQEGLTEFIVDMSSHGVEVRPILDLSGEHHFNEVTFDDVAIPADHVLGQVGDGWRQVTEQLSFERGGMERILSTYPLLAAVLDTLQGVEEIPEETAIPVGEAMARLATLRTLAWKIAEAMDEGGAPVQEAAMLKDVGTLFEGDVNELGRRILDDEVDPSSPGALGLLGQGLLAAPGFTIRGGTTEVLRTIISRSAAVASPRSDKLPGSDLRDVVDDVLAGTGGDPDDGFAALWNTVQELGWPLVGIDEERGGAGGSLGHLVALIEGLGRHTSSLPLAETAMAGRLLAEAGRPLPDGAATVVLPRSGEELRLTGRGSERTLSGLATRVPWAKQAERLLVCAVDEDDNELTIELAGDQPGVTYEAGANLAGEPRDTVKLEAVPVSEDQLLDSATSHASIRVSGSLLCGAALIGALENVYESTRVHIRDREQFGRPLAAFQAVAHGLANISSELAIARAAVDAAASEYSGDRDPSDRVAVARIVTGSAATSVSRMAHQLHGAMGITREHPLHLGTRRLLSWRDEWGTQRHWSSVLGQKLCRQGSDDVWRWLTEQDAGTEVTT
jgi:alkylation response protein AidB-like acyl-CoA dehydrogenase